MSRQETDREDLLAEATALVRRAELAAPGFTEPIVAGLRRDGGLSVYFGSDPAYHFDPASRLKRAYVGGRLYRTQGDTLAELARERTPHETTLRRHDLSPEECASFLAEMRRLLTCLSAQIDRGEATILRQAPPDDRTFVEGELLSALQVAAGPAADVPPPLAPRYRGKR